MRKKLYDPLHHRLLYLDCEANEQFWDQKWETSAKATFSSPPRHGLTVRITRRYLPTGSRVLESDCGLGDVVYALHNAGYEVAGIDYAPKVVRAINENWPHLNVTVGDVRHLPCEDGFCDGYWSFGVIEHFSEGYDAIACEMRRVLRTGGYLFLSFPSFNPFRQSRAAAGKYPQLSGDIGTMTDFYQFALNPSDVQAKFESLGFALVEHRGSSSLMGLIEDWPNIAAAQHFLDHFPSRVGTGISMVMDLIIGRYVGHSSLLILRKK
ncbi:MAG: class I SAM-dependent methyltransferase [Desulfobulbaceae bacterium]|nr:class I SAM-dependent methyltransferase [Desulfobulbaceae bacterium]